MKRVYSFLCLSLPTVFPPLPPPATMSDYYAIDAILADTHKLACTFTLDVAGIGFLEGASERDVKQYGRAELPFWMAERLSFQ